MEYYGYSNFNPLFALLMCLVALFGLASCFFGFKIQKFFICLETAIFSSIAGILLAYQMDFDDIWVIISAVVMAIIGGILGYAFFKLFVILVSGVIGYLSMLVINMLITGDSPIQLIALFSGAVIGILSAVLIKPIFIISTAISGGILAGYAIYAMFDDAGFIQSFLFYGSLEGEWANTLGILLVIAGLVVQIITNYKIKESTIKTDEFKQQTFLPTTVSSQTTAVCSNCNCDNIYDDKNKFCKKCGTKLQPPSIPDKYCAYCGTKSKPTDNYCLNCGLNLIKK